MIQWRCCKISCSNKRCEGVEIVEGRGITGDQASNALEMRQLERVLIMTFATVEATVAWTFVGHAARGYCSTSGLARS